MSHHKTREFRETREACSVYKSGDAIRHGGVCQRKSCDYVLHVVTPVVDLPRKQDGFGYPNPTESIRNGAERQ